MQPNDPIKTLANLVNRGLEQKGWSAETAAKVAKRMGLVGLGARNIRAYRAGGEEGGRKRKPTEWVIRRFAKLFGDHADSWLQHFPEYGLHPLLLDKDAVIRDQAQLRKGDEVSVISSRDFLEAVDKEVRDVVLKNLDRGIIYKYYFPSGTVNPHGDKAAQSYERFRRRDVGYYLFSTPPVLLGYSVNPAEFRYFSGLHTIVRFNSRTPGVGKTYVYIELAQGGSGHSEQVWYLLPDRMARQIAGNLEDARNAVPDGELPVLPLNPCLRRLGPEYIKWFQQEKSAIWYSALRPVMGHFQDRCLRALMNEIAKMPREGDVRYLDIGCGDGEITRAVAEYLAQQSDSLTVVGLDASSAQLDAAKAAFEGLTHIKFRTHKDTFEKYQAQAGSFRLVTAIHSLYTIDEAYVRSICQLLEPGGIACIWMAMRQGNVVTAVCDAVDSVLRPGQKRNVAEDVERYAQSAGLSPQLRTFEATIPSLLDNGNPTADGHNLINFCALQSSKIGKKDWDAAVRALRASHQDGRHPLTDGLVIIQRRP